MPYFRQDFFDIEQRIVAAKQREMDALIAIDVVSFAFLLWNLTTIKNYTIIESRER